VQNLRSSCFFHRFWRGGKKEKKKFSRGGEGEGVFFPLPSRQRGKKKGEKGKGEGKRSNKKKGGEKGEKREGWSLGRYFRLTPLISLLTFFKAEIGKEKEGKGLREKREGGNRGDYKSIFTPSLVSLLKKREKKRKDYKKREKGKIHACRPPLSNLPDGTSGMRKKGKVVFSDELRERKELQAKPADLPTSNPPIFKILEIRGGGKKGPVEGGGRRVIGCSQVFSHTSYPFSLGKGGGRING